MKPPSLRLGKNDGENKKARCAKVAAKSGQVLEGANGKSRDFQSRSCSQAHIFDHGRSESEHITSE